MRILGFPPLELVGRSLFAILHPDDVAKVRDNFDYLVAHPGESRTCESRFRRRDGTWCWFKGKGSNLLHEPDVQAMLCHFHEPQ
jgi:PAS domain S-box-containing protein